VVWKMATWGAKLLIRDSQLWVCAEGTTAPLSVRIAQILITFFHNWEILRFFTRIKISIRWSETFKFGTRRLVLFTHNKRKDCLSAFEMKSERSYKHGWYAQNFIVLLITFIV
jgi:hypothetical protein